MLHNAPYTRAAEPTTPEWRYWLFDKTCKAAMGLGFVISKFMLWLGCALLVGKERREFLESFNRGQRVAAAVVDSTPDRA